ncbi:MAG: hypothetical protein ABSC55_01955 [Syntrophorhabdales bacterium]
MEEMGERPLKMNILRKRMYDLGWPELTDFVRATRLQLSFETCRRAIYDDRQNIRYEYIVRIMQALEFTPEEIAEELKRRGDENLHKLVAESTEGTTLSSEEKMLIGLPIRKSLTGQPYLLSTL